MLKYINFSHTEFFTHKLKCIKNNTITIMTKRGMFCDIIKEYKDNLRIVM